MRKYILAFILCLIVALGLQAQGDNQVFLKSLHDDIVNNLKKQKTKADSLDFIWYAQLIKPFTYENELPVFYFKYDSLILNKTNDTLIKEWVAYNRSKIAMLIDNDSVIIRTEVNSEINLLNHTMFSSTVGKMRTLKWHEEFAVSANTIDSLINTKIKANAVAYSKFLDELYEKYENKYSNGYRQRNLYSFLADGYIYRRRTHRMNKRYSIENDKFHDPSRFAITLISPPILMMSTNSFKGSYEKGNVLGAVQLIGADYYVDKKFKHYIGFSFFHASPIDSEYGLWDGSYAGIELHWNNKVNIGIGRSYKKIEYDGGEKIWSTKLFFSYALFDKLFKK